MKTVPLIRCAETQYVLRKHRWSSIWYPPAGQLSERHFGPDLSEQRELYGILLGFDSKHIEDLDLILLIQRRVCDIIYI